MISCRTDLSVASLLRGDKPFVGSKGEVRVGAKRPLSPHPIHSLGLCHFDWKNAA